MKRHVFAFATAAAIGLAPADAQPASATIDAHLAAAKRAACSWLARRSVPSLRDTLRHRT
jgi:hypothetical protein